MLAGIKIASSPNVPALRCVKPLPLVPNHVAIIMDGNGRWATQRSFPRSAGHFRGIRAVRRVVAMAREIGIKHLTLFAFSTENWQRNEEEVSFIMRLLERYLNRETRKLAEKGIRIRVIGDRTRFSCSLLNAALEAEKSTVEESAMHLTLAVSYGGQDEIVSAARKLACVFSHGNLSVSQINREEFARHLMIPGMLPVDLLIRTGGEQRLSNFLLWQLAYAELVFLPVLWPDFNEQEFTFCLETYRSRARRYGKERS